MISNISILIKQFFISQNIVLEYFAKKACTLILLKFLFIWFSLEITLVESIKLVETVDFFVYQTTLFDSNILSGHCLPLMFT